MRLGTMRASWRHHCVTRCLQRHEPGISGELVCQHVVSDEEAKTRVGAVRGIPTVTRPSRPTSSSDRQQPYRV
jgi:hypothetical protein